MCYTKSNMELPILLLALVGFGESFYLFDHRNLKKPHGAMSSECVHTMQSRYAHLWYIHTSIWGMISFGLLFFAATLSGVSTGVIRETFGIIALILTVFNAVISLLLLTVLLTIVRRYCVWCYAIHAISFAIFILALM